MSDTQDISGKTLQSMCEAADEVDQIRSIAKDLHLSQAERFLGLAWWFIEDEIRDASGACSNGNCVHEAKERGACGTCREYKRLTTSARLAR